MRMHCAPGDRRSFILVLHFQGGDRRFAEAVPCCAVAGFQGGESVSVGLARARRAEPGRAVFFEDAPAGVSNKRVVNKVE